MIQHHSTKNTFTRSTLTTNFFTAEISYTKTAVVMRYLKQKAFPKQIAAFHCLLLHSKGLQAEIIQISCHQLREFLSCMARRTSTGCRTMPHMLVNLRFILTVQHCGRYSNFAHWLHPQAKSIALYIKRKNTTSFCDYMSSCVGIAGH